MAEAEFSEYHHDTRADHTGRAARATLLHWVGAVISVGLIAGLGVWGYRLAMRDVTGIPVVRALDGPMRIQPEDPGGQQARHQGLAVNRVQAEGEVLPTAETLILAPTPIELIAADKPITDERPAPRRVALADTPLQDEPVPVSLTEESAEQPAVVAQTGPAFDGAEALETAVEQAVETVRAETEETPDIIPTSVPGIAVSMRPPPRPELDISGYQRVASLAAVGNVTATTEVDPDAIPPGTRLVQLGAFDTAEIALGEWQRLQDQFADYFAGKAQVIQKASRGGREFYRLRVMGFADLSDARRFCSVLLARDAACIPVSVR